MFVGSPAIRSVSRLKSRQLRLAAVAAAAAKEAGLSGTIAAAAAVLAPEEAAAATAAGLAQHWSGLTLVRAGPATHTQASWLRTGRPSGASSVVEWDAQQLSDGDQLVTELRLGG